MRREREHPVRNLFQKVVEIWTDPVDEPVTTDEVISVTSHVAYNTGQLFNGLRSGLIGWAERRESIIRERMREQAAFEQAQQQEQQQAQQPPQTTHGQKR